MRYCVCAKVEGDLFLSTPGEFELEDLRFEFKLAPNSRLSEIAVSIVVPENMLPSMASTIVPGEDDVKFKINIGGNRELYDRLISELKLLESNLSFATIGALKKIHWNNPCSIKFIPETASDNELLNISSYSLNKAYPSRRAKLSINDIGKIISNKNQSEQLKLAKAFLREGIEYYCHFNYIQAFYSFYFIIEDFYANGKTGESEVLKQFSQSTEFQEIIQKGFAKMQKDDKYKSRFQEFFKEAKLEPIPENLAKFLFRMRGKLHHFHSKSSKLQGTPLNQSDFQCLSLFVMYIASDTIIRNEPDHWTKAIIEKSKRPF